MLSKEIAPGNFKTVITVGEDKLRGEALAEYRRLDDELSKVYNDLIEKAKNGDMTLREALEKEGEVNYERYARMLEILESVEE